MDVKKVALYFGVVLAVVGLLGFIPGVVTDDGLLLGIFRVDTMHNLVHLVTGAAGIYAGTQNAKVSQMYFKVFGVVYALVTVLGLLTGSALGLSGVVEVNTADNLLHVAITALALYFGFGTKVAAKA